MFEGIEEFVAVAQTQGFSSAARKLSVSTSHVSRKVAQLEARMGITLLIRTTRQVKLTSEGQLYYERCLQLINGFEAANNEISNEQIKLSGTLRVSAAGDFAERFIAPALINFVKQHPELTIELDFNPRLRDLIGDGFDFAIRYAGNLTDSSLIARKLISHKKIAAASPAYLATYGTPNHPEQLNKQYQQFPCIISVNNQWQFANSQQTFTVPVDGQWQTNNARCLVTACKEGLGIAYLPVTSFGSALENGQVIPVLEQFCRPQATSWIVYPNQNTLPAKTRMAIDYLIGSFS